MCGSTPTAIDINSIESPACRSQLAAGHAEPVPSAKEPLMSQSPVHTAQNRVDGAVRSWMQRMPSVLRPGPALGYDLMRAYLGIGLFVRGVLFVSEPELLLGYLQDIHSWFLP